MIAKPLSDPRWLTSSLLGLNLAARLRLHLRVFAISVVWLGLVYIATVIDGTTVIPGEGKGLLEHGGYIALHLATPIALSLALLALEHFAKLMARIKEFLREDRADALDDVREHHLSIVNLHSRWTWLLILFVSIGALCSTIVLAQVIEPTSTYGNDVFNACRYSFGYYTANTYLALSWTLIFPISLFIVLQVTATLVIALRVARTQSALVVDLLHADNCGGLSPFGDLNLILMLFYVPPFAAMSALAATHSRDYLSLMLPAGVLSLVFALQSVVGVYSIHLSVRSEKRARLVGLHDILLHALQHPTCGTGRELTFLLWQHVRGVKTMPYAANVQLFVAALRYVPPAVALYNIARVA